MQHKTMYSFNNALYVLIFRLYFRIVFIFSPYIHEIIHSEKLETEIKLDNIFKKFIVLHIEPPEKQTQIPHKNFHFFIDIREISVEIIRRAEFFPEKNFKRIFIIYGENMKFM